MESDTEKKAIHRMINGSVDLRAQLGQGKVSVRRRVINHSLKETSEVEEEAMDREEHPQPIPEDPRLNLIRTVLADPLQLQALTLQLGLEDGQKRSVTEIAGVMGIPQADVVLSIRQGIQAIRDASNPHK